jgi:hypothetical protein
MDNTNFDIDNFFESLEKEVNGSVFDGGEPNKPTEKKVEGKQREEDGTEDVGTLKKELETLRKRYEDSSKEAKRLYSELTQLSAYKDYVPLLEAMKEDPGLIETVKSYLESGGSPSVPEDFYFDPEEAIKNPNSDSARYLQRIIDARAQAIVESRLGETTQKLSQREMLKEFQQKHGLTEDQMQELIDWGSRTSLTLEDLWYLKNKGRNEELAAKKAQEEFQKQLAKMKNVPGSLASMGSSGQPDDEDQQVFKAILGASGKGNIFNNF